MEQSGQELLLHRRCPRKEAKKPGLVVLSLHPGNPRAPQIFDQRKLLVHGQMEQLTLEHRILLMDEKRMMSGIDKTGGKRALVGHPGTARKGSAARSLHGSVKEQLLKQEPGVKIGEREKEVILHWGKLLMLDLVNLKTNGWPRNVD